MADLSITASSVISTARGVIGTAGETITAGALVYKDTADSNKLKLAVSTAEASALVAGVALNGADLDQPVVYASGGDLTTGGAVTVGEVYVVSAAAAGGIAPVADLASTNYLSIVGIGNTATTIEMGIDVTGIVKP